MDQMPRSDPGGRRSDVLKLMPPPYFTLLFPVPGRPGYSSIRERAFIPRWPMAGATNMAIGDATLSKHWIFRGQLSAHLTDLFPQRAICWLGILQPYCIFHEFRCCLQCVQQHKRRQHLHPVLGNQISRHFQPLSGKVFVFLEIRHQGAIHVL